MVRMVYIVPPAAATEDGGTLPPSRQHARLRHGRCYYWLDVLRVCAKHGAYGTCKFGGCTSNAQSGSSNCRKHGGGKKPCSVAGCTTNSRSKGLCHKHGGGVGECVFGGCTNVMASTKWKTCSTHGGKGYCAYSEEKGGILDGKCLTPALKWGGYCTYIVDEESTDYDRKCWTPATKWGGNCKKHTGK